MTSCTLWYRHFSVVKRFEFVQAYDIVVYIKYLHINKNKFLSASKLLVAQRYPSGDQGPWVSIMPLPLSI